MLEAIWGSWLWLGILSAPMHAIYMWIAKTLKGTPPVVITTASLFLQTCVFWPIALSYEIPSVGAVFWSTTLASAIFLTIGMVLIIDAVQRAPLTLTVPYQSITPAIVLVGGWLVLGQSISVLGLLGLTVIGAGTYLLNVDPTNAADLLAPARTFVQEFSIRDGGWKTSGVCLAVLASLCYAPPFILATIGIEESNLWFYAACLTTIMTVCGMLYMWYKRLSPERVPIVKLLLLTVMGVGVGIGIFRSLEVGPAAYVASLRRFGTVLAILIGMTVFRERSFWKTRLAATLLMVLGAVILAFD